MFVHAYCFAIYLTNGIIYYRITLLSITVLLVRGSDSVAVKNHKLDAKIIQSATAEFMEYGFQGASLRRIAQNADLSTGALYTRYKNKDALFCSIIENVCSQMGEAFEPMRQIYMEAQQSGSGEAILHAIRQEKQIYFDLIFRYYDECVLLFCRSEGSSVQAKWEQFMEYKTQETVAFLNTIAKENVDFDVIEMLLSEQFYCYQRILQKGMSKEKAISCLQKVEEFHDAGWRELFCRIL